MKKKMKRSTKRRSVSRSTATRAAFTNSTRGFWGRDTQMVMMLASGIIILIVAGMLVAGWM